MTFTCRFGKVSTMLLMLFGDVFVSDVFQSRICNKFMEFLDLFLLIYIHIFDFFYTKPWRTIWKLPEKYGLYAGKPTCS